MISRTIKTKLVAREEVFKVMALGEALQMPVLLEGPPGTGKSNSMYDYAGGDKNQVFLVELDTGSKASEVKGFLDMKALLEEKKYATFSPIAEKPFILINEVEKGSSDIRNTLLSIMQEKQLQLGSEGVKDCHWKVLVGSCNRIPADERKEPFWDRFLIKHSVSPLTPEQMKFARQRVEQEVVIRIPEDKDLPSVSEKMVDKFDELTATTLSDRARMAVTRLAAAVKLIWEVDDYQALCKVASFLCPELVPTISSNLIPKEVNEMKMLIKNIDSTQDYDARYAMLVKLSEALTKYSRSRDKDPEMLQSLKADITRISDIMEKHLKQKESEEKKKLKEQIAVATDLQSQTENATTSA